MPIDWFPLWLSLEVACAATVLSVLAGLGLAWVFVNKRFAGRDILDALITLPLALPPTVLGYYLLVVLSRSTGLGVIFPLLFTAKAAVLAAMLHSLPLLVKSARASLENIDRNYEQAARSLGASEWRVFWRISLPLARRPIAAAAALAFARSLGDFGTTLMIAGDIPGRTQTASVAIFDAVNSGNTMLARALVLAVSVLTAAVVYLANWLENRRKTA